jgi:putative Flp pilus-assembly TadE/G-like protein
MKSHSKFSRGQTAALLTMVLATLLGALSLGTDVMMIYYHWMHLQKGADAAALAGASQLLLPEYAPKPPDASPGCASSPLTTRVACNYAVTNGAKPSEVTVNVPAVNPPKSVPAGAPTIQVILNRVDIPVYFLRVLGRRTPYSAVAAATAALTPINSVHNGLFPAGMPPKPNGQDPTYGIVFQLLDYYSPGNWGWLDIPNQFVGGPDPGSAQKSGGANQLATNIVNDCTCDVSIGNWLFTKPGVSWGPVYDAVATRQLNGTTVPPTLTGDEPQLVLVPVIDWSTSSPGVASPVKIFGFAEIRL